MPSLPTLVIRILLAALLVLVPACSRRTERLVGNERLARGPDGLGETRRDTLVADRDTWVETGTRTTGPLLVVARTDSFEAVTLLKVAAWNLPSADDPTLVIRSVVLFAPSLVRDSLNVPAPFTIELRRSTSAWDSTSVEWPGPAAGALLATTVETFLEDTLTLDLTAAAPLDTLKNWARYPSAVPGLQLQVDPVSGPGIAAYYAGRLTVRIAYERTVSGSTQVGFADSPVTEDLFVHSPAAPLAAGDEPVLRLGGPERFALAIRFPPPTIPAGAAIHEVALLLPVDPATDTGPFLEDGRTLDLEVRTLEGAWVESVTSLSGLLPSDEVWAVSRNVAYHDVSDSVLTIRLPQSVARGWSTDPSTDHGLLVTPIRGEIAPQLLIDSRESARQPRLRVSYTPPPKERF